MEYFLTAFFAAAGIFILFSVIPSVVTFFFVFGRHPFTTVEERRIHPTYYAPYLDSLEENMNWFSDKPSRRVLMTANDGAVLCADYYPNRTRKTAVIVHGYKALPLFNGGAVGKILYEEGYSLLFVTQRGFGESEGQFITFGLREQYDVIDWVSYAKENLDSSAVILFGTSMGGASVCYASDKLTKEDVGFMIIDSAYSSVDDQLRSICRKKHLPSFLLMPVTRLMVKLIFGERTKDRITDSLSKTDIPAIFIYGTSDTTISPEDWKTVPSSCASPHKDIIVEGAEHVLALYHGGKEAEELLRKYIIDSEV